MRTVAETDGLGDPTRISRPVIILSPPRSGSTLLFEALARSPDLWTFGGESHAVFEGLPELSPSTGGWSSNRLLAEHADADTIRLVRSRLRAGCAIATATHR